MKAVLGFALFLGACVPGPLTLAGIEGGADSDVGEDGPGMPDEAGADGSNSEAGEGGSTNDGAASGDGGTPGDCGEPPSMPDSGAISCGDDDAGQQLYCAIGDQCCVGGQVAQGYAPNECAARGSACSNPVDGGVAVQCEGPADCMGGETCCLHNANPKPVVGCGYDTATGGTGTSCQTNANCIQICRTNTDCPTTMNCTPLLYKTLGLGFCN